MKACKSCGCVNDNINRYCRNCGASFEEQAPPYEKEPNKDNTAKRDEPAKLLPGLLEEDLTQGEDQSLPDPFFLFGEGAEEAQLSQTAPLFTQAPRVEEAKPYIDFDLSPHTSEPPQSEGPVASARTRYSTHPIIDACKRAGASSLFLAYCVLSTITAVLMAACIPDPSAFAWIYSLADLSDGAASSQIANLVTLLRVGGGALLIPCVLTVTGSWLLYSAARNRHINYLCTRGLSAMSAASIIKLVYSILTVCVFILAVVLYTLTATPTQQQELPLIYLGCGVICVLAVPMALYHILCLVSIGKIRKTARTGENHYKLSLFVAVSSIVLALNSLSVGALFLSAGSPIAFLLAVCYSGTLSVLAASIISYRVSMRRI